jgi:hypothetical protein
MDGSVESGLPAHGGNVYRSGDEILHELVEKLNDVCRLLKRRARIKGTHRSIVLGVAIYRIQRDAEHLRRCVQPSTDEGELESHMRILLR